MLPLTVYQKIKTSSKAVITILVNLALEEMTVRKAVDEIMIKLELAVSPPTTRSWDYNETTRSFSVLADRVNDINKELLAVKDAQVQALRQKLLAAYNILLQKIADAMTKNTQFNFVTVPQGSVRKLALLK